MAFEFRCQSCGEIHRGMPGWAADAPLSFYAVPEAQRPERCVLTTDECAIDDDAYFIRGCLEIPVHSEEEQLVWGIWVSLSQKNFITWQQVFSVTKRSHVGPFFGWLDANLKPYPDTMNLKTRVHLRDNGVRPWIELEPTEHPLAVEQRQGISSARVAEIYALIEHDQ